MCTKKKKTYNSELLMDICEQQAIVGAALKVLPVARVQLGPYGQEVSETDSVAKSV